MSRALMFQGLSSNAGKSLIVAGLCRAFADKGLCVRAFKPQNMSNNAAVVDGGEIGRAQFLQAQACRIKADIRMNPVLLKPESDSLSQVIVKGRIYGRYNARDYRALHKQLLPIVSESFTSLCLESDLVLVEGAGSAGEVNLRSNDIANMGFATAHKVAVVVIGNIELGGVIASLVGLHSILPKCDSDLISGFIINKFRGDVGIFTDGIKYITDKTGWDCFGVLPYMRAALRLPAEDSASLDELGMEIGMELGMMQNQQKNSDKKITIVIPRLPRIANFDDFDPLRLTDDVEVKIIPPHSVLPACDLIIIPGTKSTIADLRFIFKQGWDIDIKSHVRLGGRVLGICGGYQMLGRSICDPSGVEGKIGDSCEGLGLLDVETILESKKTLLQKQIRLKDESVISGYEIHMGKTSGSDCKKPFLPCKSNEHAAGASSKDGKVAGVYLHGLFANDKFRHDFLLNIGYRGNGFTCFYDDIDSSLDLIANELKERIDLEHLYSLATKIL